MKSDIFELTSMVSDIRNELSIKGILKDIRISQGVTPWGCDNHGAIQSASKIGFCGSTKRVDVKLECTRVYVQE